MIGTLALHPSFASAQEPSCSEDAYGLDGYVDVIATSENTVYFGGESVGGERRAVTADTTLATGWAASEIARIVGFVTDPAVVRKILAHLERRGIEARWRLNRGTSAYAQWSGWDPRATIG